MNSLSGSEEQKGAQFDYEHLYKIVEKIFIEAKAIEESLLSTFKRLTVEVEKNNINYILGVDVFLNLLDQKKVPFENLAEIFKKFDSFTKLDPYYNCHNYALGMIYFIIAEKKNQLFIALDPGFNIHLDIFIIGQKEYSLALEFFTKVIHEGQDYGEIYHLIAACHAAKGNFDKAINLLSQGDKKQRVHSTHYYACGLRSVLKYLIIQFIEQGKHKEAYELGKRLCLMYPHDPVSYVLFYMLYKHFKEYRTAIKILSKFRKNFPTFYLPLHLIGINLMGLVKLYYASIYFEHEIEILNSYTGQDVIYKKALPVVKILFNFARGMWFWNKAALDKAREHFDCCAKIIRENNIKNYDKFVNLPKLIDVDNLIDKLPESKNSEEFISRINHVLEVLSYLMKDFGLLTDEVLDKILKDPDYFAEVIIKLSRQQINILDFLFLSKSFFIFMLIIPLKERKWLKTVQSLYEAKLEIAGKKMKDKLDLFEAIDGLLGDYINIGTQLGFKSVVSAYENLKDFLLKLGMRALVDVSEDEWLYLMRTLKPSLKSIGSSSTQHITNYYIINIGKIEITSIKGLPTGVVEPEKGVVKLKGKTKILTNVLENGEVCDEVKCPDEGFTELQIEKRAENKVNYLIWLDCRDRTGFVFGEPFISRPKEDTQLMIAYLLSQNGRPCEYKKIYKVIHPGSKYEGKESQKKVIIGLRRTLCGYHKTLEDYIDIEPGVSLRLRLKKTEDAKPRPVCVIFKNQAQFEHLVRMLEQS